MPLGYFKEDSDPEGKDSDPEEEDSDLDDSCSDVDTDTFTYRSSVISELQRTYEEYKELERKGATPEDLAAHLKSKRYEPGLQ